MSFSNSLLPVFQHTVHEDMQLNKIEKPQSVWLFWTEAMNTYPITLFASVSTHRRCPMLA
jgi:hypothetical protein